MGSLLIWLWTIGMLWIAIGSSVIGHTSKDIRRKLRIMHFRSTDKTDMELLDMPTWEHVVRFFTWAALWPWFLWRLWS